MSNQQMAIDLCLVRASSNMASNLRWCSLQPGIPSTKAFWSVQVPIAYHEMLPPLLKDGGVHLAQAGGEGNGPEVGG